MPLRHMLLALIVAFIWGTNFVAIKYSYESFQPFALLFVRFVLSAFPLVFFIPKPKTPWLYVFGIACFAWIGQFSFLFLAVYLGASPGLASVVLQSQTIFTVLLSAIFLHYKPGKLELVGLTTACAGITGIAFEQYCACPSWIGFLCILPAALSVSASNIIFGKIKTTGEHPLSLVVWSSLIPPLPMLALSFYFEGPGSLLYAWEHLTTVSTLSVAYTVYFSTLLATSLWAYILRHHAPSIAVPFMLLIPVFGMGSSAIMLCERYSTTTLLYSFLVILGLGFNQIGRRKVLPPLVRKVS